MTADQAVLLQGPIDGRVFLEVLQSVGRPAECVRHFGTEEASEGRTQKRRRNSTQERRSKTWRKNRCGAPRCPRVPLRQRRTEAEACSAGRIATTDVSHVCHPSSGDINLAPLAVIGLILWTSCEHACKCSAAWSRTEGRSLPKPIVLLHQRVASLASADMVTHDR